MLRHSISQIFQSQPNTSTSTPPIQLAPTQYREQEQRIRKAEEMISSLQPRRPVVPVQGQTQQTAPSQPPPRPPMNQQPTRPFIPSPGFLPRTQIEALPPFACPASFAHANLVPTLTPSHMQPRLDPSRRHPVFFTDRLKKAPNGVFAGGQWGSPVAEGYILNDGSRRGGAESEVKL